jgi:SAM-dependent methyltransferase
MIDFTQLSDNLLRKEDEIWYAKTQSEISYPEEGNAYCLQLEENSYWFQHRNNCIIALVKHYSPNATFFDIGGGNGFVARGLENAGISTVLVEPGQSGARNAKARGLQNIVCATTETSGFEKDSIDAIGLFDVVEHIDKDEVFLAQNYDFLRKDGMIYMTVPAYNFLWSNEDDYAGHFRRHTISSATNVLKKVGFEIVYSSYLFSILPLPILLFRSLPSKLGFNKKENDLEKYKKEHSKGTATNILQKVWDWELSKIKKQQSIGFGSSVLIVGRK